jgi:hypothetical protein
MGSWRDIIIWAFLLGVTGGLIWLGYQVVVRTSSIGRRQEAMAQCHLCGGEFPLSELVSREKMAGFVNYFCVECIAELSREASHTI